MFNEFFKKDFIQDNVGNDGKLRISLIPKVVSCS